MRLFYYVHTGHRIGLDRFRRAATIIRALGDVDITLLTSDFRIASAARDYGVKRAVGIDVVRNIPQIAHHGDKIIFDSSEANPLLLEDMRRFFSTFIRVSDDPEDAKGEGEFLISPYLEGDDIFTGVAIDPDCFQPTEKKIKRAFFFGDDDYEEDLLKSQKIFKRHEFDLLLGFYWFMDYEQKITDSFGAFYESEDYDEVIRHTDILLSASPQAVLENLACGGRPIFLQRPDYPRDFIPYFESLNIPVVDGYDEAKLSHILDTIASHAYHILENNTHKLSKFLKAHLDL